MIEEFVITNSYVKLLAVLIMADIITGIFKATKNHSLKSSILRHGGYKKFVIILIVVLSYSIDKIYFQTDVLYTISITYFTCSEMVSILENAESIGVKIPKRLKTILAQCNKFDDKGD
jgi:toxin secretion/phage lysis holin